MMFIRYSAAIRPVNNRVRRARRARYARRAATASVAALPKIQASARIPARIAALVADQGTGPLSSSTGAGRLVVGAFHARQPGIQLAA
jgi:hypothetical protein